MPSLAASLPADARREDVWKMADATWSKTSTHLAFQKPTCTAATSGTPCGQPAGSWSRCRTCKRVIARCGVCQTTDPMLAAKAAHEERCEPPPATGP